MTLGHKTITKTSLHECFLGKKIVSFTLKSYTDEGESILGKGEQHMRKQGNERAVGVWGKLRDLVSGESQKNWEKGEHRQEDLKCRP